MSMQSLTLLRSLYFHCPCNLSPFSVPYTSIVHAISHLSPFLILPLYTLSMKYLTLLRSLIILPLYTLTMQSLILLRFLYFHCNTLSNVHAISHPSPFLILPLYTLSMQSLICRWIPLPSHSLKNSSKLKVIMKGKLFQRRTHLASYVLQCTVSGL